MRSIHQVSWLRPQPLQALECNLQCMQQRMSRVRRRRPSAVHRADRDGPTPPNHPDKDAALTASETIRLWRAAGSSRKSKKIACSSSGLVMPYFDMICHRSTME